MIPGQQTNQKVRATRGFYAHRAGQFGVVNPGDVVEISNADARMLAAAGKAEFVDKETALKIDPNYLPERKKDPHRLKSPIERQLALQTEVVTQLKDAVSGLTEIVKSLVADAAKAKAEKTK